MQKGEKKRKEKRKREKKKLKHEGILHQQGLKFWFDYENNILNTWMIQLDLSTIKEMIQKTKHETMDMIHVSNFTSILPTFHDVQHVYVVP